MAPEPVATEIYRVTVGSGPRCGARGVRRFLSDPELTRVVDGCTAPALGAAGRISHDEVGLPGSGDTELEAFGWCTTQLLDALPSGYTARVEPSDADRFAYLRSTLLLRVLENDKLLNVLVRDFEVPGKPAFLKALPPEEKFKAIAAQIEHLQSASTSQWHDVHQLEILAAHIFQSNMPEKFVAELFADVKTEAALKSPVTAWLRGKDMHVFDEVPMGTCRADLFGYKKGGFFSSSELIAVELKNDVGQLRRGLDQMTSYGDYAHKVYLACTPFLAANYLATHAGGAKVKRWDGDVLNRKLGQIGAGLLLVEGGEVFEYVTPRARKPDAKKWEEIEFALRGR